jgi:hypothetical protein
MSGARGKGCLSSFANIPADTLQGAKTQAKTSELSFVMPSSQHPRIHN